MAISTAVQRMAISQLGTKPRFLAVPSGAVESYDRLMLIRLYSFTASAGTSTRRRHVWRWFRNQN